MKKIDVKKMNRRQKIALVGIVAVLLIFTVIVMWQTRTDNTMSVFELPETAYAEPGVKEITAEEYEKKIEEKESFLILAHSVACPAGMPLTDLAREVAAEKGVTIYSLIQAEFKESSLAREFKYLPSLAIVRGGRVVAWLDAESNADLPAYQSAEGLEDWLSKYVKL